MTAEPAVLARNTSYFTLALVAQKVISFLYFTFLARYFGPEAIGKYVFALSLTTLFSVLLDLGFASVLTREVARDPKRAEHDLGVVLGFKTLALWVVVALVILTVNLLGYPTLTRQLVYIACGVMLLDSIVLSAYSTLRGFHTLTWESLGSILFQVVVALAGLTVAQVTRDLRAFMFALLFGAGVHAVYALWQVGYRYQLKLRPRFENEALRKLLRLAWPFALAAILTRAYGYVDTILLSLLAGDRAVGLYSVAYKVTFALQFIPVAFSASLFPGFSTYFATARDKLAETFTRGVVYLASIAAPVAGGIIVLAPSIVRVVYPQFIEAILPLQILIFSLIFLFLTFPVGALLPACDRQARNTLNIGLAALTNLGLNLWLIPRYGPVGAAVASLVSTLVLLGLGWVVVRQLVEYNRLFMYTRFVRIVAAALIMTFVAWGLNLFLHFGVVVPIAGLVYLGAVVGLGGITREELFALWGVLVKRQSIT